MQGSTEKVLGPNVAGSWYPAEHGALRSELDRLLGDADDGPASEAGEPPLALIAPHAGFAYSGAVAARAFRRLCGCSASRVVLIGPSHYESFRGAVIPQASGYRTPLGPVRFDLPSLDVLARAGLPRSDRPYRREHCLEAEIPFLQRTLGPDMRLVPLLLGAGSQQTDLAGVAELLGGLIDEDCALVVSSDFTHYGPRFGYVPFQDDVEQRLRALDFGALEHILQPDRSGFADYLRETGATVCGRDGIDVLLRLLPAGSRGELLSYDTSGRMTDDWQHSVSYASLAFSGPERGGQAR